MTLRGSSLISPLAELIKGCAKHFISGGSADFLFFLYLWLRVSAMFQPGTVVAHLFHYSFFFFLLDRAFRHIWVQLYKSMCLFLSNTQEGALFSPFLFPFLFCIVLLLANNKNNIKRSHYRVLWYIHNWEKKKKKEGEKRNTRSKGNAFVLHFFSFPFPPLQKCLILHTNDKKKHTHTHKKKENNNNKKVLLLD